MEKSIFHREFVLILIVISGFLTSCEDDIEVIKEGPTIPVVYGLLNPNDTVNYIRLTRTFIGKESVAELAGKPENLFYQDVIMTLDINSPEGYPMKSFPFEKVILENRIEGLFVSEPNITYQLKGSISSFLNDKYQVRLSVILNQENKLVSAQQTYRTPPQIINPKPSIQSYLSLYYSDPLRIEWQDIYGYSRYEVLMRLNFSTRLQDSIVYSKVDVGSVQLSNATRPDQIDQTLSHFINGDDLLRQIGLKIINDSNVINRSLIGIDIMIACTTEEFLEYEETNQIASDRLGKPVSNIVNGMGVFALRTITSQTGYLLDPISMDSLVKGQYTKHLRFVRW
ncbi:MAG: hypothetical protein A2X22_03905 [Bacteroidetes bacterium GWF2_49_14]|nr:MAG: hypothetical protein A2X22_03905 [Bacteroidetes bacterium GWF2_49_14]